MVKKREKLRRTTGSVKSTKKYSDPKNKPSLQDLLQQALARHQVGHLQGAEVLYRQILSADPDHPAAMQYLGVLAHQTGKSASGVELVTRALVCNPDYVDAHVSLGVILNDLGRLDEAVASFGRALALKPDYAEVYCNLGNTLRSQGKLAEAAASFGRACVLKPDFAEGHYNLGNVLRDQGKLEESIECYRRALALRPDYCSACYNAGKILERLGRLDEAVSSYRRTLELKPDWPDVYFDLGNVLKDQGRFDEAVTCYRRALVLKPDFFQALNNLGFILFNLGELAEAIGCFRQGLRLKPDYPLLHSNLLTCLNYLLEQSAADYLDEARRYGQRVAGRARRFSAWRCSAEPERLRIGLVSGDFGDHPVGYFLENMLAQIDLSTIELIAYSTCQEEDTLTSRIRSKFAAWKPLPASDEEAAHLIYEDGVHLLLDLAGHTDRNRLPVFAWKPAPVQASWLGYFASTGLAEMDYIIADRVSVPENSQRYFAEKVWYLPDTRLCFSPPVIGERALPLTPLPALRNGYLTFGCFQNLAKVNDEVLAVWGNLFQKLPTARLRLQDRMLGFPQAREQLKRRLARYGINGERVQIERSAPREEYLASHAHVDIILDTFPFPGGTTTCEALWMGVPTITICGNTMMARQGASLLTCAGLADWLATDAEEYVGKALAHAVNLENLSRLRAGLREQVLASPLFDGRRFAGNFEAAMWGMWRCFQDKRNCSGGAPQIAKTTEL